MTPLATIPLLVIEGVYIVQHPTLNMVWLGKNARIEIEYYIYQFLGESKSGVEGKCGPERVKE